jgi:hypothetical protein
MFQSSFSTSICIDFGAFMSLIRCVLATLMLVLMTEFEPNRRVIAEDDLDPLSLVGESAAVCLEVSRCEAVWKELQSSRMAARLKQFPPVERFLGGSGFQQWTLVEEHVRRTTGKSLSEHLLGAFSESLVVAVYLPDGKPPEGVVIGRARDTDALAVPGPGLCATRQIGYFLAGHVLHDVRSNIRVLGP